MKQNGIKGKSRYNQVANYVDPDTTVNISIGEKAPKEYFPATRNQSGTGEMKTGSIPDREQLCRNLELNCMPENIFEMTAEKYFDFLKQRRREKPLKIKNYCHNL